MTDKKPTYEELLKWHGESEKEYKAMEVFKSFLVCAGMMAVFMFIEQFARVGAMASLDVWKLSGGEAAVIYGCLNAAIGLVYLYMFWHFTMMILFTYKEDIDKFGDKWKAFKAWCKKEKEASNQRDELIKSFGGKS